jgi:thiol-disulfide isomerase/thioredoxin
MKKVALVAALLTGLRAEAQLPVVKTPLTVVVFLSPECPLCQGYSPVLNALQEKYAGVITLVGVFPGKAYGDSTYEAFRNKYHIAFRLMKDKDMALVKRLGATTTPEAFLLKGSQTLYQGAIDDKVVSLGQNRLQVSKRFLEDAIAAAEAGRPALVKKTEPVGCLINNL